MKVSNARKAMLMTAGVVATAVGLAACGGGGSQSAESGAKGVDLTLRVVDYYSDEPDRTFYQEALDTCSAEVGVKINREVYPGAELMSKILQMSSSRTLPDVLMIDNPEVAQVAATGALTPIEEVGLSAEGEAPGVIEAATYDGKVYGLQPVANTLALYYNVDILEEAGVDVPSTWDELKEASSALTEGSRYGIAFSAPNNYEGAWQFLPFMWSNGGSEDDLNTPQVAEAMQLWVDLVHGKAASESVVNWTQSDVNDQFKSGKAAMMINGPWQHPSLDATEGLNWSTAPIPTPKAGEEAVAPLGGEVWTLPVSTDEAKQAAAVKLIECLNSDEMELHLAEVRDTIPTRLSLQEQYVEDEPHMAAYSELIASSRARTGLLGPDWPEAGKQIYDAIQLALVGGKTPDQALAQVTGQ